MICIFRECENNFAQVKDQCNLNIFYMKVGEKISTNLNYARENLPIDPICVNTALKGKNVPDFYDCVKCFDIIKKTRNIDLNPQHELQNKLLNKGIFMNKFLITCH